MGCLILTIVLAAIVAVVYYTWTNFGWAWGVGLFILICLAFVAWCLYMAPVIDEESCHVDDNDFEDMGE